MKVRKISSFLLSFFMPSVYRTQSRKAAEFLSEHRLHRLKGFSLALMINIPKIPNICGLKS